MYVVLAIATAGAAAGVEVLEVGAVVAAMRRSRSELKSTLRSP